VFSHNIHVQSCDPSGLLSVLTLLVLVLLDLTGRSTAG
jgi:hypothetical protein